MMVPCYLVFAGFFIIYAVAWLRGKGIDMFENQDQDPRVPPVIGICEFLDGRTRYVYEDAQAGQYVVDDDGERVYGVWIHPDHAPDTPAIVDLGTRKAWPTTEG